MIKKYFVIHIFINLLVVTANAKYGFAGIGAGGYPGYFLDYGVSARTVAMGGAYISISDDSAGIFYNPALTTKSKNVEIQGLYTSLVENTRYNSLAAIIPLFFKPGQNKEVINLLTLGFSYAQLYSDGYEQRDEYNYIKSSFGISDTAYLVSLGYRLSETVGFGVCTKYFSTNIMDQNYTANTFDLGSYLRVNEWLNFGLVGQNVYSTGYQRLKIVERLPLIIGLGTSVEIDKIITGFSPVLLATDFIYNEFSGMKYLFGLEYVTKLFTIRVGYDNENITSGFGIAHKNFKFDYALISLKDFGFTHRLSGGINFGLFPSAEKTVKQKEVEVIKPEQPAVEIVAKPAAVSEEKLSTRPYDIALKYFNEGNFVEAKLYAKKAVDSTPDDSVVQEFYDKVVKIIEDEVAPELNLPEREIYVSQQNVSVSIPVSDNVGLKKVCVEEKEYEVGFVTSTVVEHLTELDSGSKELKVTVFDYKGNSKEQKFVLKLDKDNPVIEIVEPQEFVTAETTVTVRIVISDNIKLDFISINNEAVKVSNKEYIYNDVVKLTKYGENVVNIMARDITGNEANEQIVVIREKLTPIIAVLDFTNRGVTEKEIVTKIANSVRTSCIKSGKIQIMKRYEMLKIFEAHKIPMQGCDFAECGVTIGKLLNVNLVVVGNVSKIGETYYITITVVNVKTGAVEYSSANKCDKKEEIDGTTQVITKEIIDSMIN